MKGLCLISIALAALLACTSLCSGQDLSLRIKALGSELAGIVADEETDVLQNPARLALVKRGKVVGSFNPRAQWVAGDRLAHEEGKSLSIKGLFPALMSPRLGMGLFGQVSYRETLPRSSYWEETGYWYGQVEQRSYGAQQSELSNQCRAGALSSLALSPTTTIGLSYGFTAANLDLSWRNEWESHRLDQATLDTLSVSTSSREQGDSAKAESHALTLGSLFNLGENSTLELLGTLVLSDEDSSSSDSHSSFDFYEQEYWHYYSDSSYYHYFESDKRSDDQWERRDSRTEPRLYAGGLRLSSRVSGNATLRLIANVGMGKGDLSGDIEETGVSVHENYRSYTHSDPETTYTDIYTDTLHFKMQKRASRSGDERTIFGLGALGSELTLSEMGLFAFALKVGYERTKVETTDSCSLSLISDTTAAETTWVDSTWTEAQEVVNKRLTIAVPLGLERNLTPRVPVRIGVCPKLIHEEKEETDLETRRNIELTVNPSFGFGFRLSERVSFDLSAEKDLTSLHDWELEARLCF